MSALEGKRVSLFEKLDCMLHVQLLHFLTDDCVGDVPFESKILAIVTVSCFAATRYCATRYIETKTRMNNLNTSRCFYCES